MDAPKKPGGLMIALGIGKPKGPTPKPSTATDDEESAEKAAGDALSEALDNKDGAAIAAAVKMCVDAAKAPEPADDADADTE